MRDSVLNVLRNYEMELALGKKQAQDTIQKSTLKSDGKSNG